MSFLNLTSFFDCRASLRASRTFGAVAFLMLIPETDYTKERGSVIIRLRPAYLEILSAGKHTLKANFTDGGSAETTFTIAPASVKAESLPQTGDNSRLLL